MYRASGPWQRRSSGITRQLESWCVKRSLAPPHPRTSVRGFYRWHGLALQRRRAPTPSKPRTASRKPPPQNEAECVNCRNRKEVIAWVLGHHLLRFRITRGSGTGSTHPAHDFFTLLIPRQAVIRELQLRKDEAARRLLFRLQELSGGGVPDWHADASVFHRAEMQQFVDYIDAHLRLAPTLSAMALMAAVSPSQSGRWGSSAESVGKNGL